MTTLVGGGTSKVLRRLLSVVVTLAVVLSAFWGMTDSGTRANDGGDPRPRNLVIPVTVTNTLPIARPNEVVRYNLTLPDGDITNPSDFKVVYAGTSTEVLSGPLNWTVRTYPSGFIYRMEIVFQDGFGALETKDYEITTGSPSALSGDIAYTTNFDGQTGYDWVQVTDSGRSYSIQTSNEYYISFIPQYTGSPYYAGVFVQYSKSGAPTVQGSILTRLGGNQLQLDQTSFALGWGDWTSRDIYLNSVMLAVHLTYDDPQMLNWGAGFGSWNELIKQVDVISADVWIFIYNDRDMVETHVQRKVNEKFFNHNGVVMEFTTLFAGQGEYETIFGNPEHTRMWATTLGLGWGNPGPDNNGDGIPDYWRKDWSTFAGVNVVNNSAPHLADYLDNDGDLDLVVGSLGGTLYGYRNVGTPASPSWQYEPGLFGSLPGLGGYTIPRMYDLSGDGLKDLIVGRGDGTLLYYRNGGSPASPSWVSEPTMFSGIDVGGRSAPEIADVNADGLPDLLIGDASGRLTLYRNAGAPGSPVWTPDNTLVDHLNSGPTRKPGTHATPVITDVNRDGLLDLVTGQGSTNFGSLVYFESEGTVLTPAWTKLTPGLFNNVRGAAYEKRDYSVPTFGDLDGDGFEDIAIGGQNGTVSFWRNQQFTVPESHVNNMQPLEDGTYRFYYDQDSNDGQYVIRNESSEFWDYYVVSRPATGDAVLRYIPGFARLVHRDRYGGDQFPWAGGNTSYYPFIPEEDGMITRGLLISRVSGSSGGYMSGGSFLSQTGTAGGFVQVPMTSMVYEDRSVIVTDLPYDPDASTYDDLWRVLSTSLSITGDADLAVDPATIVVNPTDPNPSYPARLSAVVVNEGYATTPATFASFYLGDPDAGGIQLGSAQTVPPLAPGDQARVTVDPGWFSPGMKDVYVKVTSSPPIPELDLLNNKAGRTIEVTSWTRDWNGDFRVTYDDWWNGLDPYVAEDQAGNVWIAYHKYTTKDDFGIYVRRYSGGWTTGEELVVQSPKRTSAPVLVPDNAGNMWLIYASNLDEWQDYIATKNARYYWSMKFDLWAKRWDGSQWWPEQRITTAEDVNRSHQEPRAVLGADGKVWVTFRETGFELYSGGNQMNNRPYQDMNVSALSYDPATQMWGAPQIVTNDPGSQAFWGGPDIAVDSSNNVWVVYGTEVAETQWDVEARYYDGATWSPPMAVTTGGSDDYRPAVTVDSFDRVWAVWERDVGGQNDLYYSFYPPGGPWTVPQPLTTDPGEDRKPALAADSTGKVWAVWESDRTGNADIFASRWDGAGWSNPLQLTGSPAADEEAQVFISSTGDVWVAWQSERNGHGNMDVYVKAMPAVIQVAPPRNVTALLSGPLGENVTITWDVSASDDGEWGPVAAYEVYYGRYYDSGASGYSLLAALPPGTSSYVHAGAGRGNPDTFYYAVRARQRNDNAVVQGGDQGGKLVLDVSAGTTPLMAPFEVPIPGYAPTALFETLGPTAAWQYNALAPGDPWSSWHSGKVTNGLSGGAVHPDYGLWVETGTPGTWTTAGKVRDSLSIDLRAGWNFVGNHVLDPNYTVADLVAATGATRVEGYDPAAGPYHLRELQATETLTFGYGYWLLVPADGTWSIVN